MFKCIIFLFIRVLFTSLITSSLNFSSPSRILGINQIHPNGRIQPARKCFKRDFSHRNSETSKSLSNLYYSYLGVTSCSPAKWENRTEPPSVWRKLLKKLDSNEATRTQTFRWRLWNAPVQLITKMSPHPGMSPNPSYKETAFNTESSPRRLFQQPNQKKKKKIEDSWKVIRPTPTPSPWNLIRSQISFLRLHADATPGLSVRRAEAWGRIGVRLDGWWCITCGQVQ